jgi:hypothetical protein
MRPSSSVSCVSIGSHSKNARFARAASTSTRGSVYRGSVSTSPGYQLLMTSWSSHWLICGTRAANERRLSSSRL